MTIEFTIDYTKVAASVSNFVCPIKITSATGFMTGLGATDWQKLIVRFNAIDGPELYCEVSIWDTVNEYCVIFVKITSISNTEDTIIYIDVGTVVNSTYIGQVGSTPSDTVWADYRHVYHFNEDPSGSAPQIKDSSPNHYNLTTGGTMTSGDLIDSDLGKAIDFDGTDDYAGSSTSYSIGPNWMCFFKAYTPTITTTRAVFHKGDQRVSGNQGYSLFGALATLKLRIQYFNGSFRTVSSTTTLPADQTNYVGVIFDSGSLQAKFFVNADSDTQALPITGVASTGYPFRVAALQSTTLTWFGDHKIDELLFVDSLAIQSHMPLMLLAYALTLGTVAVYVPPVAGDKEGYISISGEFKKASAKFTKGGEWITPSDVYILDRGKWMKTNLV